MSEAEHKRMEDEILALLSAPAEEYPVVTLCSPAEVLEDRS